jgi:leucyl-tRNA synthetase
VVEGPNGENDKFVDPKTEKVDQVKLNNGIKKKMINSGQFDGLIFDEAMRKTMDFFEEKGWGKRTVNYKLRDWSVSRQRYWGAPIPIVHCKKCGPVLVPDNDLPVVLPIIKDFAPSGDGRSALGRASKDWLNVKCPNCGEIGERETDTLDTYICSSWYMMRYFDPKNEKQIFDSKVVNKWMPIDFYNGADHATAHMIYARFVTRFFHKIGLVDEPEPFKRFLFNGKVTASDGKMFSKSKGNGVDPLEIINDGYGADALRTYLMFASPLDVWTRWDSQGVPGTYRFINRVWNIVQEFLDNSENSKIQKADGQNELVLKVVHPTIKKVSLDIEDLKYNTAIAALMKCTNDLYEIKGRDGFAGQKDWLFALESLIMLMAPFAPHAAEELWHELGHKDTIHIDHWPEWDEKYLVSDTMTIVVQVNGKVRAEIEVASDASEEDVKTEALKNENIQKYLEGREPKKLIYVPGRLVSVVV